MLCHPKNILVLTLACLVLAGGTALAQQKNKDTIFCEAIGLEGIVKDRCANQLMDTRDPLKRDALMVSWVKRSPIGTKATLYTPPTDDNVLNGRPGTPYADKKIHLPNDVVVDIRKAVDRAGREWK